MRISDWSSDVCSSDLTAFAFIDDSPRGFGLLQRDRAFEHYLDGVHYERRPGLGVEPLVPWGYCSVYLLEIPTDNEIHDNIVAFWVPRDAAEAGKRYRLRYRLHWQADEPSPAESARVMATRIGRGGQPGKPRPPGLVKFVVEFDGGRLGKLPREQDPEPKIPASRGEDRKRVVSGKRVSVRVDSGGRRLIKKDTDRTNKSGSVLRK